MVRYIKWYINTIRSTYDIIYNEFLLKKYKYNLAN